MGNDNKQEENERVTTEIIYTLLQQLAEDLTIVKRQIEFIRQHTHDSNGRAVVPL